MSTLIEAPRTTGLPRGARGIREGGLLAGVHRPCPDHHEPDCPCVATAADGHMVFHCEAGDHHFTAHSPAVSRGR